ncbi:MAG: hypothetical protein U0935_23095 [Pirellulales bacterium]
MFRKTFSAVVLALVLATSAAQAGPPGGTQTFSRFYPANDVGVGSVDLIGGQSTVTVKRLSGVGPVSVRIVGELTGLEYGRNSGFGVVTVNFSHLPVAKMRIIVTNDGSPGTLQTLVY